jgi:dihydroxyacid dehydratase/phosphogluconate dehydratase
LIDDFQRISDKTPLLADLKKPENLMEDLHTVGGVPAVMKYLLKRRFVARTLFDRNWKNNSREFSLFLI